jgi:hypothetical protein
MQKIFIARPSKNPAKTRCQYPWDLVLPSKPMQSAACRQKDFERFTLSKLLFF